MQQTNVIGDYPGIPGVTTENGLRHILAVQEAVEGAIKASKPKEARTVARVYVSAFESAARHIEELLKKEGNHGQV